MNQFWKEVSLAAVMGLLLPGVVLGVATSFYEQDDPIPIISQAYVPTEPTEAPSVMLLVQTEAGVVEMDLDDYLTGVVLAEMPASFEEEALKAQAVVARTYAVRSWERGKKHEGAAVCTDSACCQGYILEENYLAKGGTRESIEKIRKAVEQTADLVLTYQGELIEATYFSCSGGSTEDAAAVWGTDVAYLQAVESPGEEKAAYYTDTVSFSTEEFARALALDLKGDPQNWFGAVKYTEGKGVKTMVIGGILFSGTDLRSALGLRSTAFDISVNGNTITITTRGYGHRVGMSQYGADAMAVGGSNFDEILAYYYQGTQLEQWVH